MSPLLCFTYALFTLESVSLRSWEEAGRMLAMAILPATLGHITLNRSLRYFAAQTFAVVNLHQFVFAGILGWLIFRDAPPGTFYAGAVLCLSGAVIVVYEAARIRQASAARSH